MGNSIVFVDSRVADIESLVAGMPSGTEVGIIDGASDGLIQIAAYLQGRSGIDAIHIISHGSSGSVSLGSSVIDSAALATHASQLEAIGQSLTESGDILLYGCNVAAGDAGVQFIGTLSQATGADVAASINATGAAGLAGDWLLEAKVGAIQSVNLALPTESFSSLLPSLAPTYQLPTYDLATFVDLAELSGAAYKFGSELALAVQGIGWTLINEASPTNIINIGRVPVTPHVFAAERTINGEKQMVIAFRGTDGLVDIVTDFSSAQGFTEYWRSVRDNVRPWIERAITGHYDEIYLTGHSLGGAVAQIAMLDMLEDPTHSIWIDSPLLASSPIPNLNDRFGTSDRTWLQGHLYGTTFGAPPAQPGISTLLLNQASIDLTLYADRLFQFEHKNGPLGSGSDPVAAIPGINIGTEVPIDLSDTLFSRYHALGDGSVLGVPVYNPFAIHAVAAYQESMLRALLGSPFTTATPGTEGSAELPQTYSGTDGVNDSVINAVNGVGGTGNDVLVASDPGVLSMNGGAGHDAYIVGAYGINVTLDGPANEHLDALYFTVAGTVIPQAVADNSEALILTIVNGTDSSTVTIPHWYSASNNYELGEIGQIVPDVPDSYWSYIELFKNDTTHIPLFNTGTANSDVIIGSLSADTMSGGQGDDVLNGRQGSDFLTGGGGCDTFKFTLTDSGVDTIADFSIGDRIQFVGFAPAASRTFASGDGSTVTDHRVQVANSAGQTTLSIDTNNVAGADIQIVLQGIYSPGSFLLDSAGAIVLNPAGTLVNTVPTFAPPNGNGILTRGFAPGSADASYGITTGPDGKIVAAGTTDGIKFAVLRLSADGLLDQSFGADGLTTTDVGTYIDVGRAVAVQDDGQVVVAGYSYGASIYDRFAVVRYNADGSRDSNFNGIVELSGGDAIGNAVAIQPNGGIVVGGDSRYSDPYATPSQNFTFMWFGAGGVLERGVAYDVAGFSDISGQTTDFLRDIAIQDNGKIVAVGYSYFDSGSISVVQGARVFALMRLNSDGSLDTGFAGGGGKEFVGFGTANQDDRAYSVAIQSDGKLLVAGTSVNGGNINFAVARFDASGNLDVSFATNGKVTTFLGYANGGANDDRPSSIALQHDGKILVAGSAFNGTNYDFAIVRYLDNGSLDTSFGLQGTGKVTTSVGSYSDFAYSMSVQLDDKVLVSGKTFNGTDYDFAIARYNANGTLDTTFGGSAPSDTLGGTASYTENGSPTLLDSNVAIFDSELSAQGNYSGASLTLTRSSGASADDLFNAKSAGTLGALNEGASLVVGATTIGTVSTNHGGVLVFSFNSNATQNLVNLAMRQIAYSNNSDAPPASVQIDWVFNDGNNSAQGLGGALVATGSTTINIAAVNDAPVNAVPAAQTVEQDTNLTITGINVADVDASVLQVSLSATHGVVSLSGTSGLSFTTGDGLSDTLVVFSGTKANVNAALHNLTYHSNVSFSGNDTLTLTTSDLGAAGSGGARSDTATIGMTVNAVADSIQSSVSYSLHGGSHNLTLTGNSSINGTGNSLENVIIGNSGNNSIRAQGGNDHINGGAGFDTAEYSGNHSDYTITKSAGYGYTITDANPADGDDGTDTLFGVESLQFADGSAGLPSRIMERVGSPTIWIVSDSQRDFNGDGKADLWWKQANGSGALWVTDGTNTSTPHVVSAYGGWSVVDASSDYNGDGKADLSWHNTNGSTMQWINAADMAATPSVGPDAGWPLT